MEGQTLRQIPGSIGVPPGHVAMSFVDSTIVHLSNVPKKGEVMPLRSLVQGGHGEPLTPRTGLVR